MKSPPSFRRFLFLVTALSCSLQLTADGLRVGAAKIDITPEKPVTLAGYASRTNLSTGFHDPLFARALALEHDGKRLLLVSVDILGFYNNTADPLRRAILEKCPIEDSALFLCAIHTHAAPTPTLNAEKGNPSNVEYTRSLQEKLATVAKQALDNLAPAQVGVGIGHSPVGVNRRELVRDSASGTNRIILGRNPHVPIDREVQTLKVWRQNPNEPAAILFSYATHSTSLGTRNLLVSGDVHGLAAQFVERYLGNNLIAPEFAGASGNIDPWYRVLPTFNTTNNWIPEPVLLGTMLGEEVVHVAATIRTNLANTAIKSAIKTVSLPAKQGSTNQVAPITITVASLGPVAFVGWGGEIFTEIGQAIKKSSPFATTFILTHCNGAAGYLPTGAAYPEGGYEVQSSPFGPGADEQLIAETQKMLVDLRR